MSDQPNTDQVRYILKNLEDELNINDIDSLVEILKEKKILKLSILEKSKFYFKHTQGWTCGINVKLGEGIILELGPYLHKVINRIEELEKELREAIDQIDIEW